MSSTTGHQNSLVNQTSPYLLQHAHNPVDWHPWGDAALERAQREDKPILLSIGYSACHWCHVMERECFENEQIAAIMNESFVCIKVDREERPDIDDVYMAATIAMTGQGGWPMNVFLTPDRKPFFAGTYFPPEDSPDRPGWPTLVQQLAQLWKERREEVADQAERLTQRLRRQFQGHGRVLGLEPELLDMAVSELAQHFDPQFGGFSGVPKFPPTGALHLLLRYYHRAGDPRLLGMVTRTLDAMANGGIYDQIGGGFARYSTDARWLVPHFEKMLYDNALLAKVYLEAYQATQEQSYRRIALETLDFVLREMTGPDGGFYSSIDADSEGEEGKFFVWTPEEIHEVLGEEAADRFCAYYDISEEGNWEGKSIPNCPRPLGQVAAQFGKNAPDFEAELKQSKQKVYEARLKRVRPDVDDKVLTSWNGLMIGAMAEAYRVLGEERYLLAARQAAQFVRSKLYPESALLRTCRGDKAHLPGFLEDYAFLADGLLTLYEAAGDESHLNWALELKDKMLGLFVGEDGGFFDTANDQEELVARHRSAADGAIPAANAVASMLLVRLAYHLGSADLKDHGLRALAVFGKDMRHMPSGFCRSLLVLDYAVMGPVEATWVAPKAGRSTLIDAFGMLFVPNHAIAWKLPDSTGDFPLLRGKTIGDKVELHLCQSNVCAAPVKDVKDLPKAIEGLKGLSRYELYTRIPGRATTEATRKLADKLPGYRDLGTTGLKVSSLGFGSYRVDDETREHEDALRAALDAGVNLIDTSSNYGDGSSERLIGGILRSMVERRPELVIVSKVGYVQGQSLQIAQARIQMNQPYPEMVEYQQGCWHCIHPDYLNDQLERSLIRLSVETLDVCLLHNPEYFLLDAKQKERTDRTAVQHEFYARVEKAFAYLEEMVAEGRIASYGVSSNGLGGPENDMSTTTLSQFLEVARKVGGEQHHFKVIQLPFNLLESSAYPHVLREAQEAGLAVLINRPLNAFMQQTLVRLADFDYEDEELNFSANVLALQTLEEEFRSTFGPFIQGEGVDLLFRFADNLKGVDATLQNIEHWNQLEMARIRPTLREQVQALDQAIQGPPAAAWAEWRERFMAQFRNVMNDLEEIALRRSQDLSDSVRELFEPFIPEEHRDATTSKLALWVYASTPGITAVLVGMRQTEYVADVMPIQAWPRIPEVDSIYRATAEWRNPNAVVVA